MSEKYIYMIGAAIVGYVLGKKSAAGDSWFHGWFN